jgi:hypothetical protein
MIAAVFAVAVFVIILAVLGLIDLGVDIAHHLR